MTSQAEILLEAVFKAQKEFVAESGQDEFDALVYLVDAGTVKTFEQLAKYGIASDGTVS
jgi:hypothetical protein